MLVFWYFFHYNPDEKYYEICGIAVSGDIDTIAKGRKEGIISEGLFQKLKPFFDFRNSLVHRYWIIDDEKLIANIEAGRDDFDQFAEELENYIQSIR